MLAPVRQQPRHAEVQGAVNRLRSDYERWAAQCYKIRTPSEEIRPLLVNPVQHDIGQVEAEMIREEGRARIYILKGRRAGVSSDQQARALHLIWSRPYADAMTLADTEDNAGKLFEITRRAIEHFPKPLLPRLGDRSTREISFPGLDSALFTGTAGAKRAGRGATLVRVHGSEFALWDDPIGMIGGITPTMAGVKNSVVVLETTPAGYDCPAHRFWVEAVAGRNGYRAKFYPWWLCRPADYRTPLVAPDELGRLTEPESALIARVGLDLEQIKWRRAEIALTGESGFMLQYPEDAESCWATAGGMFYDVEQLKGLLGRAPTPLRTEYFGSLEIFAELPVDERVIVGCDCAQGMGQDRSTFVARGFPSGRLLAKLEDATIQAKALAGLLSEWGKKLSKKGPAFLVVEKNDHGITVLRELRDDLEYPVRQIYHRVPLDQQKEQPAERIGWHTSAESKPLMLDAGRELLNAAAAGTVGAPAASAIRDAFAVRKDGRGRADLNGRDVLVAEMLAWIGRGSIPAPVVVGATKLRL